MYLMECIRWEVKNLWHKYTFLISIKNCLHEWSRVGDEKGFDFALGWNIG